MKNWSAMVKGPGAVINTGPIDVRKPPVTISVA
jgi:hypothetical protein